MARKHAILRVRIKRRIRRAGFTIKWDATTKELANALRFISNLYGYSRQQRLGW